MKKPADPFSGRACENNLSLPHLRNPANPRRIHVLPSPFRILTPAHSSRIHDLLKSEISKMTGFRQKMTRQKLSMSEINIAGQAEAIGRSPRHWKEAPESKIGVGVMAKPSNSQDMFKTCKTSPKDLERSRRNLVGPGQCT